MAGARNSNINERTFKLIIDWHTPTGWPPDYSSEAIELSEEEALDIAALYLNKKGVKDLEIVDTGAIEAAA